MAGSLSACLGRIGFLWAIPAATALAGIEADGFVILLSFLAACFEAGLFLFAPKGRKGRQTVRPARWFPMQLGLLYSVQVWLLMFHHAGLSGHARAPAGVHRHAAAYGAVDDAAAAPARPRVAPAPALRHQPAAVADVPEETPQVEEDNVAEEPDPAEPENNGAGNGEAEVGEEAAGAAPANAVDALDDGEFVLDAPPEKLRWNPKTISVVLPCAEEREYAVNTVKSFFEMTPESILHEIVVVDDGSQPPLSQKYMPPEFQKKYKVLIQRHEETVGLIGAKKTGGDAATGDLIMFFDCHVAPQKDWYKDFIRLIGENYRRMVIPQITALDVDTWKQVGGGGGMSKCYVTWDGDFKWGGPDDMYMGMLSGGLLGMSRRWWQESGGYDDQMLGWGGENIDQGVRMWVCGGEIVAAPNSQVAHMWRTGSAKTNARYKHVGDTMKNRARAINAWFGPFAKKLEEFPNFKNRRKQGGENWYGDMSHFQKVKDRLQGCRPFAWYLRRFKAVYEDGGIVPPDIFMIKDETTGKCLRFMGSAGTSGGGREAVQLKECNDADDRFFWHLGNVDRRTGRCCSGLRAWNTDQCFHGAEGGRGGTSICEVSGRDTQQHWMLSEDGQLRKGERCIGSGKEENSLKEAPCLSLRSKSGGRFNKFATRIPIERKLYDEAQRDHPETFKLLNEQLAKLEPGVGPKACRDHPGQCLALIYVDEHGNDATRCLSESGQLVPRGSECVPLLIVGSKVMRAEGGDCLDTWSDEDPETWGFYGCHDGDNQKMSKTGATRVCSSSTNACFMSVPWPVPSR